MSDKDQSQLEPDNCDPVLPLSTAVFQRIADAIRRKNEEDKGEEAA